MADEEKKISKQIDKLIMGVILGGAIGSVVGLTFAPRKGKETRAIIKKKGEEFINDHREKFLSAKYHFKKGKGFFKWLFASFRKNKTKQEPMPKATMGIEGENKE
ncbi:YtxH domain-containing protein [Candidatus Peregrinibacteria bacterium]|nr:YtxH domain-containing protein [Candidatus Peregrinibacteria bacterium]